MTLLNQLYQLQLVSSILSTTHTHTHLTPYTPLYCVFTSATHVRAVMFRDVCVLGSPQAYQRLQIQQQMLQAQRNVSGPIRQQEQQVSVPPLQPPLYLTSCLI